MVQRSGLSAFAAEDVGSIPARGTKIMQAAWCSQKCFNKIGKKKSSGHEIILDEGGLCPSGRCLREEQK